MLTLLTGDCDITRSVYSRKAAAGSSPDGAIVTVADMPSGPSMRAPTSPDPGDEFQPGGRATVILGAVGSETAAVITVPGLAGAAHVTASTGTGTWIVGTTPGGAWSLAEDGGAAPGSGFALASRAEAATGTPSLLRTQA